MEKVLNAVTLNPADNPSHHSKRPGAELGKEQLTPIELTPQLRIEGAYRRLVDELVGGEAERLARDEAQRHEHRFKQLLRQQLQGFVQHNSLPTQSIQFLVQEPMMRCDERQVLHLAVFAQLLDELGRYVVFDGKLFYPLGDGPVGLGVIERARIGQEAATTRIHIYPIYSQEAFDEEVTSLDGCSVRTVHQQPSFLRTQLEEEARSFVQRRLPAEEIEPCEYHARPNSLAMLFSTSFGTGVAKVSLAVTSGMLMFELKLPTGFPPHSA